MPTYSAKAQKFRAPRELSYLSIDFGDLVPRILDFYHISAQIDQAWSMWTCRHHILGTADRKIPQFSTKNCYFFALRANVDPGVLNCDLYESNYHGVNQGVGKNRVSLISLRCM